MNAPSSLRAGVVGLGTMGRPMARNLSRAGFSLVVFNRSRSRAQAFADESAAEGRNVTVADSPAAVARAADIVLTCLPDSPEVEDVLFREGGLVSGAAKGTLVVDSSTIAPEAARVFGERLREKGLRFLDAPVSGGEKGAIEGTLTFFVGGEAADLDGARTFLSALGKRFTLLGPNGAGQLGKAVNQVLVACNLVAVSEGLALAAKAGLPLDALHEALTAGAATSWALSVLGRKMIDRDFKPAFAIRHQQKDLAIVLRTARERGVPLPGTALAHQLLSALEAEGRGDDGTQALFTLYEKLSSR